MAVVGLQENPRALIKDIGVGKQQLVEIASPRQGGQAVDPGCRLSLNGRTKSCWTSDPPEGRQGRHQHPDLHKLNELYCADRITVIRDGRSIETLIRAWMRSARSAIRAWWAGR